MRGLVCVIPGCAGLSSSNAWSRGSDGILATSLGFARCFCKPSSISQVNFAIWRPFLSLEVISQPFQSLEMISQQSGIFADHFAAISQLWNERNCAAKWHSCAKEWFRSCETPFQMASRLRNSHSDLHARLQMAITSSFHLQIAYRLKCWTPNFPRFETRYGMHNLSSRKCFKNVSNSSEMEVRHFRSWFARSSSNGHNFSVSNPNRAPFEAMDSWLPKI